MKTDTGLQPARALAPEVAAQDVRDEQEAARKSPEKAVHEPVAQLKEAAASGTLPYVPLCSFRESPGFLPSVILQRCGIFGGVGARAGGCECIPCPETLATRASRGCQVSEYTRECALA